MTATKKKQKKHSAQKEGSRLLKRRVIATSVLVLVAGFASLSAFVWTNSSKADTNFDPFFSVNTSSPKVRVYQPLEQSLDNPSNFTANGVAMPNATVTLKVDGSSVGTTTADAKGQWSKAINGVGDGNHQLTASATIPGPLAVVTSQNFTPGFGVLDLSNNAITSAYSTGLSTLLFTSVGPYTSSLGDTANAYSVAAPQNSQYVYLIRNRTILIFDITTQKIFKTVNMATRFGGSGSNDNGQLFKSLVSDEANNRLYMLYSDGNSSNQVIAFNTQTNALVSTDDFNPQGVNYANSHITLAADKLYVSGDNSNVLYVISTNTGAVDSMQTRSGIQSSTLSPDKSTLYLAEGDADNGYFISTLATADNNLQEAIVDLGSNYSADAMYAGKTDQKLYLLSKYTGDLRIIDLANENASNSIPTGDIPATSPSSIGAVFNDDGSRMYIPLQNGKVAVVNTTSGQLVAHINTPGQNYDSLTSVMYYNNKLYMAYNRQFSPADVTNISQILTTIGIADATTSSDVTPQTITANGTKTGLISSPITIAPQTYSGSSNFSVGTPLSITSPSDNDTLATSAPIVKGTGPAGKKIQVLVGTGTPADVTVGSDGKWQTQVTLPKNALSKITATYNNKRTQVVLPNHTILGSNLAKTELSIIDGASSLQQQPINFPDTSLQSLRLNNSAAINPNGQRYYVVSSDATSLLASIVSIATSGSSGADISQQIVDQVSNSSIGVISVYSAQTRQQVATISLPPGMIPLGITVSPDGKKGMVSVLDVPQEVRLLSGEEAITDHTTAPGALFQLNLEDNTVDSTKISYVMNIAGFNGGATSAENISSIFSAASGVYLLSRPGNYSADGSKFYTTAFSPGKLMQIDTSTKQQTYITLPESHKNDIYMSTQLNKSNGILYATYINVTIPTDGGFPTFIPGIVLIDTNSNQVIGQSALPNIPLFGFAVSSSGTKLYFETANFSDILSSLNSTPSNSSGLFADSLPQFELGVYDLNVGSYTSYPITNNELPLGLALTPDDSRVFIPTLTSNTVHVFDTATNQMDPGNAPINLPGQLLMFGTGDYVASATIGAYSDTANYFVPADVVDPPVYPPVTKEGTTKFVYLPATQQAAISAQSIALPQQTVKTFQQTIQKTVEQQKAAQTKEIQRNWLIYIFYVVLMGALGAIGLTIWRTDMLLGNGASEDLFA